MQVRDNKHKSFLYAKGNEQMCKNGTSDGVENNNNNNSNNNNNNINNNMNSKWPQNTILITGDSILNNIQEHRLRKNFIVKVRAFPGANTRDMYDYIAPLLKKEPKYIFLHIGSNDAVIKNSDVILDDILQLKSHNESVLPNSVVYLSCPILRFDKAGLTLVHLRSKMKEVIINIISNENVDSSCLGKAGLHLNSKGTGLLAMNFISLMKRL